MLIMRPPVAASFSSVHHAERVLLEHADDRIQLRVVLVAGDEEDRGRKVFQRVDQRLGERQREVARVLGVDQRVDRIDDHALGADALHVIGRAPRRWP